MRIILCKYGRLLVFWSAVKNTHQHYTPKTGVDRFSSIFKNLNIVYNKRINKYIKYKISSFKTYLRNVSKVLVWFQIKQHAPPLVKIPVNSLKFQPCGHTSQAEYLTR